MLEYDFVENVDYQCLNKSVQMPNGGFKEALSDVVLSLDCAKEISMLQRSDKGKQARLYFIEVEKKYNQSHLGLPQTYAEALRALADKAEEAENLRLLHIRTCLNLFKIIL